MKKCIYLILCGFLLVSVGNKIKATESTSFEIDKMLRVLERHNDVKVEEWIVTAREVISISTEEQFLTKVNQVKAELPDFKWKITRDSTNLVAVGMRSDAGYSESVSISSALTSHTESYFTYEMRVSNIHDKMLQDITNRIQNREKALFWGNATFFTCVKGEFNDTIDKVLTTKIKRLMKEFQATEVESLKEENFISITASTPFFKQSYVSDYYNLQLAMRNDGMGTATSFVIGTPIITFEY